MEIDLAGKTAIVTGATGQLGRVLALTLARCGADVAIHYNSNEKKANELKDEILKTGRRAVTVKADITDISAILHMRDELAEQQFFPDIVVCNAIIQFKWTTVLEQAPEDYENQFRSSVLQNVFMAKAFIPRMIEKNSGRFIGINTEAAMMMAPTQSAYASGKRGMDGVLKVLAKEIGEHQITVNEVAPGWIVTEQERVNGMGYETEYIKTVPLRRRGTDQDVANAVAFLASDFANYITGAYIPVCGGNIMPAI